MADFRRWILALAVLAIVVGCVPASAQQLVCSTSTTVVPILRHEGMTELVGDILLTCTGGAGATPVPAGSVVPQADITVTLSAPLSTTVYGTWPVAYTANEIEPTDAVLVVDDPSPANQTLCTDPTNPTTACQVVFPSSSNYSFNQAGIFNVFQGVYGGPQNTAGTESPYSITFLGVPVDPPTTTRTYRITNLRINASGVPAQGVIAPVYAYIAASSSTSIQINNTQVVVGSVSNGLVTTTNATNPSLLQCQTYPQMQVGSVTFQEEFATAFKVKTNGVQNVPGAIYYSESGLEVTITNGSGGTTTAGEATTGTRLQAVISNIPPGTSLYVDSWAASTAQTATQPSDATLVTSGTTGTPTDPYANTVTQLVDGSQSTPSSVTAVWEVTNTNPFAIDSLTFGIYISTVATPGAALPGATTVTPSFNPLNPTGTWTDGDPIPEFAAGVNVQTAGSNLFTFSLCQTILLFPYVTDYTGFDTGIAVSITSMDPTLGATGEAGACTVYFYGEDTTGAGTTTNIGTAGVYTSTDANINTTGNINPGQTWAFDVAGIDTGYASTSTYGMVGYAIATCNFQYAHGYSFVSDYGVRNFAAAYLALVIPDAARTPLPFMCASLTGTSAACNSNQTGEQLVH